MRKVLRIIGLIIASIVAGFYLAFLIGSFFDSEPMNFTLASIGMAVLSIISAASVIVAWFNRRIGVWLVLGAGVLFSIFGMITAGQRKWMAIIAAGGPLIVGGLLMLFGREQQETA
jgi:hypothetical protein